MGAGVPTGIVGAGVRAVMLPPSVPSIESSFPLPVVGVDASVGSRVGGSVTAGGVELRGTEMGGAEYWKSQSMSPPIS